MLQPLTINILTGSTTPELFQMFLKCVANIGFATGSEMAFRGLIDGPLKTLIEGHVTTLFQNSYAEACDAQGIAPHRPSMADLYHFRRVNQESLSRISQIIIERGD